MKHDDEPAMIDDKRRLVRLAAQAFVTVAAIVWLIWALAVDFGA